MADIDNRPSDNSMILTPWRAKYPDASNDAPIVPSVAVDCPCCETGCCGEFSCEPMCVTLGSLKLYNDLDGSLLYTFPGDIKLTVYADAPDGTNLFSMPGYLLVDELVSGGEKVGIWVSGVFSCGYDDPDDPTDPVIHFFLSVRACYYNGGITYEGGLDYTTYLDGTAGFHCDFASLEASLGIFQPSLGELGVLDLRGTLGVHPGACGVSGERCYSLTCTNSGGYRAWCCDDGASWFCSPRVPPDATLTATVTSSTACAALPIGTTFTLNRTNSIFGNLTVRNAILPVYGQPGYSTTEGILGFTCSGDWWITVPTDIPSAFSIFNTQAMIGTLTAINSCNPLDIEITCTANPINPIDHSCSGVVLRITE